MRCTLTDISFGMLDCTTRLPFRFGITTMTEAPTLTCRCEIETPGGRHVGYSADLLVPKWFEKNPDASIADDQMALVQSAEAASAVALDGTDASAFDHWIRMQEASKAKGPSLVRGFGIALVERALVDAVCRGAGVPFAASDAMLGFDASRIDEALRGVSPLVTPASSIALRHTVGLVDPIRDADVESGPDDGLPVSLEENIRVYGLTWFKLKVCGDVDSDVDRLSRILDVLPDDAHITLDGNEQFESVGDLHRMFDGLDDVRREALTSRLVLIEQPLARARSFDRDRLDGIGTLPAPVIIDEADGTLDAFPEALECGYRGVSVKNCKGVFRAMINACRCRLRPGAFQSAEDLTNLGVLALQQDLATASALGLPHVERNGHQYFRGLDHLPVREAKSALEHHPDLYLGDARGVRLKVEGGTLRIGSLQGPGFGYASEIEFDARRDIGAWKDSCTQERR